MISKLNEVGINRMSSLYIKNSENIINKIKEKEKLSPTKTNNSSYSEKDEINELESITKYNMAKSYNKYRRNMNLKNSNIHLSNKSYIQSFKSNLESSFNCNNSNTLNRKHIFFGRQSYDILTNHKDKNKEKRENNLNKSNINIYTQSNPNLNTYNYKIKRYKYYNKYKEANKNQELLNSQLINKQNTITTNTNLNQTSFNEFRFYKYKPNKKEKEKEKEDDSIKNNISKNKDENSDIPTCESSDPKLSFNDFSIRKTYRYKKNKSEEIVEENKRYEKGWKKGIDKNKFYNKLKNTKIPFGDNTCNRKIGVRKFYKQKLGESNCK